LHSLSCGRQLKLTSLYSFVIFSHLCSAVIRRGNAEIEAQTSERGVPVKAETFAERFFDVVVL